MGLSSLNLFRKKVAYRGSTARERAFNKKSRDFKAYFENSLNLEDCLIDSRKTKAIFQDHSQSNNKDLSDDKYVIVPNEESVGIGSYIEWRKSKWLVFTEEFKTIPTHQQLKIKTVNETIKWIRDGSVCNGGEGWGAYVQNQTLYTLGITASGNHMQLVNAKMMMYMKNNEETMGLQIGQRIFIGYSVYKVMFKDIVSRVGLINYLLEEDTLNEAYDNVDLAIADYWKPGALEKPVEPTEHATIEGEDQVRLGRTYTYKIQEGFKVKEWIVDTIDTKCLDIQDRSETHLTIRVIDDSRNVGTTTVVYADVDGDIVSKALKIKTKF